MTQPEKMVTIPLATAEFSMGILANIAQGWERNADYYARAARTPSNDAKRDEMRKYWRQIQDHVDILSAARKQ